LIPDQKTGIVAQPDGAGFSFRGWWRGSGYLP